MAKLRSTSGGALYVTVQDLNNSTTVQKQIKEIKQSDLYKQLTATKKASK